MATPSLMILKRALDMREPDFLASLKKEETKWMKHLINANVVNEHEIICYCEECCELADKYWWENMELEVEYDG